MNALIVASVSLVLLAAHPVTSESQGTFQNLDFESAIQPLVRDAFMSSASCAMLFPDGLSYVGGTVVSTVCYNTITLDAAAVTFQSPESWLLNNSGKLLSLSTISH